MTDQLTVDAPEAAPPRPATSAESRIARWRRRRSERVSKWDRPPEPRDWRFFVGALGRVLIATGILMFGFVAYQLWGTGIETARAQNRLEDQFEALIAEFGEPADDRPADVQQVDDQPVDDATDADDTIDDAGTVVPSGVPAPGLDDAVPDIDVPAPPVPVDLSDAAVEQEIAPIVRGDVLARLEIPAIGRVDYVVPGVSLNDLKSGPGHYPDTPLPGQLGNASIAGHRTTYGAPFFDVDRLVPGDELIVTMANGDRFVYEVTGVEIVGASDYWVVTTSNPNYAELTLTSCHPKYTARDRIIVHSLLNPAKSSSVGVPTFYELEPDPDDGPIPGDDPVLADGADDTAADDTAADDTEPDDAEPDDDDPADDLDDPALGDGADDDTADDTEPDDAEPDDGESADAETDADEAIDTETDDDNDAVDAQSSAGSDDGPADERGAPLRSQPTGQVEDAFSQGWFDDMAAWPQIALWGTALTIISIGAYLISRRFRHDSIGFLVGIGPFLVALYFFFQNVNRLLPPGI